MAQFLEESSLPLAMGIFLVFRRRPSDAHSDATRDRRVPPAADGDVLGQPLLFAAYSTVPPRARRPCSVSCCWWTPVCWRSRWLPLLHAVGGLTTLIVLAEMLAASYVIGETWTAVLAFTAGFVMLYLAAPPLARRLGRPFEGRTSRLTLPAPLLLFVFPVLAAIEPAFVRPLPLFGTLLVLLVAIAWRAMAESAGSLYYVASFFAIATQAIWSGNYLTDERLRLAVAIYTVFGVVSMAAPAVARRSGRRFQPAWGSGAVMLASLVLLAFVSLGPVTSAGLWALALLLAIMNAGLFVESASGGLPAISQIGSLLSWGLLGIWRLRAAVSSSACPRSWS